MVLHGSRVAARPHIKQNQPRWNHKEISKRNVASGTHLKPPRQTSERAISCSKGKRGWNVLKYELTKAPAGWGDLVIESGEGGMPKL